MIFVYIVLSCLFTVLLWLTLRKSKCRLPPGPKGNILIGVLRDLDPKTAHLTLAKWAETHGSVYSFKVLGLTSVVISDVRLVRQAYLSEQFEAVLNDRPDTFVGKHLTFNYSDIGFAKYHDATLKLRKCLHKAMHFYADGVKKFETLVIRELEQLVNEYRKSPDKPVDPRDALEQSFCRLIFSLLLGRTMINEDGLSTDFMWNYLNNVNKLLDPSIDTVMRNLPFLRFVPSKFRTFFNDVMNKRNTVLNFFYTQQKATYDPGRERGLVDALIRMQCQSEGPTDEQVMGLILDAFAGSLLTSTNAILAVLLILMNNPDIMSKVYDEVSIVVGTDRFPQFSDRADMPYLEAVILESLRYISHATLVFANLWHIHHDPKLWPDPWKVKPNRFLDEEGKLLQSNSPQRYHHLPFGVGPRNCLDESLAKSRLVLYIATLVQQFDIKPGPDMVSDDPRHFKGGFILEPPKFVCRFILEIITTCEPATNKYFPGKTFSVLHVHSF